MNNLRKAFLDNGFDIRYVGGCVRDRLNGDIPKDIDLATDASPDIQISIYQKNNFRYVETGLKHGTITVILDQPYEITSLRKDVSCDGRHAEVEFTTDWTTDLGRRDLTINAMSMDFDNNLFDPFNGKNDLQNGIVRFVGNPETRIREDYLRILRWFRFFGRYGKNIDHESTNAISKNAEGLRSISRERIWSEISKILIQERAIVLMNMISVFGVHVDLPDINFLGMAKTKNAVANLASIMSTAQFEKLAEDWKMSNHERKLGLFITTNRHNRNYMKMMIENGKEIVQPLAEINGDVLPDAAFVFPITGKDLIDFGMSPGKELGQTMAKLYKEWEESEWTMTKDQLLAKI